MIVLKVYIYTNTFNTPCQHIFKIMVLRMTQKNIKIILITSILSSQPLAVLIKTKFIYVCGATVGKYLQKVTRKVL